MKKSVIAKGKRAKSRVFRGEKVKTTSGLGKKDLMKNKAGEVVSRKSNAAGVNAYLNVKDWADSVSAARKMLALKGFVAVNGKSPQGRALYIKAKDIYSGKLRIDRRTYNGLPKLEL